MSTLYRLTVFLLVLSLVACTGGSVLEQNRQKWQDAAISHYRYEVSIGCFCPWGTLMPLHVEVKDGQVVSLTDKDGNPVPENFAETFNKAATIEDLFAVAETALNDADEVQMEYDPTYGFPTTISIDYIKAAVDDEIGYSVTGFEVIK
jgi:hypothetical protein